MKRSSSSNLEGALKLRFRSIYYWVTAGWLAYAAITLFSSHKGTARYNLTPSQTTLLQLTVIVPVLIIWLVATYGAVKFRRYADMIKDSADGKGVVDISTGLLFLIAYLIASTLVGTLATYAVGTSWVPVAVTFKNHLPIVFALMAFALTYRGSAKLAAVSGANTWSSARLLIFYIPFCLFAAVYTWMFYLNPDIHKVGSNGLPAFNLSNQVLLFTYILPYLITWLLASLTALNIRLYAKTVSGTIYRSALAKIASGIIMVVLLTIALQLLITTSSTLNRLNLSSILLLVYLIVLFDALGYGFIALGAKRLVKIEEAQ